MSGSSSFKLSEKFIEIYADKRPPFGFGILGELTYIRTYSRIKEDGTNEQWFETCRRVVEGTYNMQKRHIEGLGLGWSASRAQHSAQEMYDRMFDMKFLPPGRGLWAMGSLLTEERGLFAALNNCAFVSTTNLKEDLAKPFVFLMDMSMVGVGVGFDTKGAGQLQIKGPNRKRNLEIFRIPDTREGWVESVKLLLEAYFLGTAPISFDYQDIRPEGSAIKGFGGISAGPKPLQELHTAIQKTMDEQIGTPITITTIVDIMNLIGKAVVAGNVRRTAEIVFGDPTSTEYIDLKNYKKNPHRQEYGWTSNNSIFAKVGMDYRPVCERISDNGEPGLAWLDNMRAYSRMNNGPDNKDARADGGNPCLAGSTLIAVADGRNAVRIDELVGTSYPVYSRGADGKVVIAHARKTWKTRENAEVVRVTLDDGSYFTCTPDHRVMLRDGTFREAVALVAGISLKPFNSVSSEKGYRNILDSGKRASGRRQYRLLLEHEGIYVDPRIHAVHHKNYNKTDDCLNNLEVMPRDKHSALHRLLDNPMKRADVVEKMKTTRAIHGGIFGRRNPMFGKRQSSRVKNIIGIKSRSNWKNNRKEMIEAIKAGVNSPEVRKRLSNSRKCALVEVICPVCHAHKYLLPAKAQRFITCSYSCSNVRRGMLAHGVWNHRVVSVEHFGKESVYDIEVEGTHNFGIITSSKDPRFVVSSGVFVHNCLEQTLESYELCCLVETFPARHDTKEDYMRTLKFAYLYAKTVTLGQTHWPETNRVLLRNRRIGCSISGVAQFVAKRGLDVLRQWMTEGYEVIQRWDEVYSDWLAVPRSRKTTSIKPSGTVSILAGATPGVHWPKSRWYIRRIRLSRLSPLVSKMEKAGYHVEPCFGSEDTTVVVEIPVDIGVGVRTQKQVSMWEQLSMAAFAQKYWADNQVSITVTFDPATEAAQIPYALDYFQYQLKGVSFLPDLPEGAYPQMPYETITEERFNEMTKGLKKLTFGKVKGEEAEVDRFCNNETCEFVPGGKS